MAESKNVIEVKDQNFDQEVLKSTQVTLVDFWAEWCGPCRMLAPIIDEISNEFVGKLKVCKMNVDLNPTTPTQYRIRGIPTILIFKNGQVAEQLVGNQPKDTLIDAVCKHLG